MDSDALIRVLYSIPGIKGALPCGKSGPPVLPTCRIGNSDLVTRSRFVEITNTEHNRRVLRDAIVGLAVGNVEDCGKGELVIGC